MPTPGYTMPPEWIFCDSCYRNKCDVYPGCLTPRSCSCPSLHDPRIAAERLVENLSGKWSDVVGHGLSTKIKLRLIDLLLEDE